MERSLASVLIALALAGCGVASMGAEAGRGMYSAFFESTEARRDRHAAEDDAKCRGLGFTLDTEAYGHCRLQLEQIRATQASSGGTKHCYRSGTVVWCK